MRQEKILDQDLSLLKTEEAIHFIKLNFQKELAEELNLIRVSAPIFVAGNSGIQDNLDGNKKPVSFKVPQISDSENFEIVHSLAKWKRLALMKYGIKDNKGLYTDMNALRPEEDDLSTGIHSVYVDQWDWEKIIRPEERTLDKLQNIVERIYKCIIRLESIIKEKYFIRPILPGKIKFIHSEELYQLYPQLTPKEREDAICKKWGAVFIVGIGAMLPDHRPHDDRAPDYDDWTSVTVNGYRGLNGDILVYNPVTKGAFELSSMGIRVNPKVLKDQLIIKGSQDRKNLYWHQLLLNNKLPQTIGGGIGQSRLCMFFLRKRHIGEVQASVWPEGVIRDAEEQNINLL